MKKTLKIALSSLAAAALLFAMAACSGPDEPSGQTPSGGGSGESPALDYPTKDINLIVPYAAGGNTDLFARAMSTELGEIMGVNVVVQNVEGGGGCTGTSQAVNSAADGYTLALPANSAYVLNPQVNNVGYTAETTTPICIISEAEFGIAVASDSPYSTLDDLLAAAAADPNGVTYSTPGTNSAGHLMVAAVGIENGLEWNHSPNTSAPGAIAELVGGHIDAYCSNLSVFKTSLENGDIKLLAVTGDERDEKYPDVPTFKELGYDYPVSVYFCLVGPEGMDPAVVEYISDSVAQALEDPTVQDAFVKLDQPISFLGCDEFAARLPEDITLYNGLLKDLGVIQ